MKHSRQKAQADIKRYMAGMNRNDVDAMLAIEEEYGLDGYPPNIVIHGLSAAAEGRDVDEAIDEIICP